MNGFAGGIVGGAVVRLFLDPSQFNAAFKQSEATARTSVARMEGSYSRLGVAANAAMMMGQVALVAFLAAGVKGAIELEGAFKRISALTPIDPETIASWRSGLMGLSNDTGIAVTELADALFFLGSSGMAATEVMPALEAAAKGAAAGLGSTADVAKVTAYVLAAYSQQGMKATDVTDTLVAAIAQGNVEPDEFAAALGRVIPIAAAAGVTFQEVAGSLAVLSRTGLDADEGVTALRGLLNAIVAPSVGAARAMEKLGYSTDELRTIIKERGALAALRELWNAADQNIDAFKKIVPNVRALTGALSLTGQEAAKVDEVMGAVLRSTGATAEAFKIASENAEMKLARSMNTIKNAGIELGQKLVPVVVTLAKVIGIAADHAAELFAVFIAYKGLTWLPVLIQGVAYGLSAIGATNAAASLMGVATSTGVLGVALHTALPELIALSVALLAISAAWKRVSQSSEERLADRIKKDIGLFNEMVDAGMSAADAQAEIARSNKITLLSFWENFFGSDDPAKTQQAADYATMVVATAEEIADATAVASQSLADFTVANKKNIGDISPITRLLGISYSELAGKIKTALEDTTDRTKAWAELTEELMADGQKAIDEWSADTAAALNFVDDTFVELASSGEKSMGKIISDLKKSLEVQVKFNANLERIADRARQYGVDASFILQTFINEGPKAADTVAAFADSGKDAFMSVIDVMADASMDAGSTTKSIQDQVLGVLRDIADILERIARHFNVTLDVDVKDAELDALILKLKAAGVDTSTASRIIRMQREYGGALATGGVVAAANGIVSSPTYLVGEGSYSTRFGTGAELVQPLNEKMLERLGSAIGAYSVKVTGGSAGGNTTIVNVDAAISPMDVAQNIEWWRRAQGR